MNDDQDRYEEARRRLRAHRGGRVRDPFFKEEDRARIEQRLVYLAQRRYLFAPEVATGLARSAIERYLEAAPHYADWVDHPTHLLTLLRGECREHIRRQICLTAQANAIRDGMPGITVPEDQKSDALDDIAARDARKLVFEALFELRPKARDALHALRDGATRIELLDVIDRLGLNKPSDASSLRTYRNQLRTLLARCGIRI